MRTAYLYFIAPFIAYVLYKIVTFITIRAHHNRLSRNLGCKPAPKFPDSDPLGISNVVKIINADKKGRLPEFIEERFRTVSKQESRSVLTFRTHVMRNWLFATCDPKNIQAILATQFTEFELGPIRFGTFSPLLGHGIFSVDGEAWDHSRALLRPQFTRGQVSDLELEEHHLQNLLQALPTDSNGDNWTQVTDLLPLFFRLTMDSASEFLFGESVNTQLAALPSSGTVQSAEDAAMVAAFEKSQDCIAYAFRFNDWYPLALTKEYYKAAKVCHAYIDRFVQKAIKHEIKKDRTEGGKERYVFLEALAAQTQDPILIRDQLLSILVAGRDTTASLLSFTFLLLAQHPHVFDKLRAAVLADFGTYAPTPNWNKITFSNLKSCQYLQYCLSETLRLYPTVPLNSRRSIVDTTLPRGGGADGQSPVFVPKGTEVNYSVYAMHRNKSIWGPDADKFIPERWEGRKAGWDFLPFNGGPRICLGQQFALTEAGYVTVRLLQRFDKLDGTLTFGQENDWYLTLTGRPRHGVKLRLHAAAEVEK